MTALLLLIALAAPLRVAVSPEPPPSRARYVASREGGVRGFALPSHEAYGWSQRARLLPDGSTEITVVSLPSGARPARGGSAPPEAPRAAVADDVRTLAHEIVAGSPDAWESSARILTWVSLNVRHADDPGHEDTADLALSERRASCVGRSRLAAELLRAAGIPARTIHGLLADAEAPSGFRLHRFVESFIDGIGWVPSDPGESVHLVDARHVFIATDEAPYDPETQRTLRVVVAEPLAAALAAAPAPGLRPLVIARRPDPRVAGSRP